MRKILAPTDDTKKSTLERANAANAARLQAQANAYMASRTAAVAPKDTGNKSVTTRRTPGENPGDSPGGGGGDGGYAAAQARANRQARSASRKQNEQTAALVDAQHKLLTGFGKQRDTKLANITAALESASKLLLENYGKTLGSLQGSLKDNEMSEADASFRNVSNAIRERGDILAEAAMNGAGETDLLRAQLNALRNHSANQGEVNRSFFDTLRSVNNSIMSLNTDTATSRTNLFNQAESDREAAWANYYNQTADTWTQIGNIENSNSNIDSDTSVAYKKKYGSAADEAAKATSGSYKRKNAPGGYTDWAGKGKSEERSLTSSNRSATVNLGGPQKRAEGATLRKWK